RLPDAVAAPGPRAFRNSACARDARRLLARAIRRVEVRSVQPRSQLRAGRRVHRPSDWRRRGRHLQPARGGERGAFDAAAAGAERRAMTGTLRRARRKAGAIRRRLFEPAEMAAWRRAWHLAETTPRFTPGEIRMLDYELRYSDLLSFCPQWQDIFVKRTLDFRSGEAEPRILDCGANVGLASLYFRRVYPGARITAYEADPALFAMLDVNLAANRAADVERIHAALWTTTGTLTFS